MEIQKFNFIFEKFKEYSDKMPGIAVGLDLLKKLDLIKEEIILKENSVFESVDYYNYLSKNITTYCFRSFNLSLRKIYVDYLNENIVLKNELYNIICSSLSLIIMEKKYNYILDYDVHAIASKFAQSLRKNRIIDITTYFCDDLIKSNYVKCLDITDQEFRSMIFDVILDLREKKVLFYEKTDNSIAFNPKYKDNLRNILYSSFDQVLLGENKLFENYNLLSDNIEALLNNYYEVYKTANEDKVSVLNDVLITLVITSTTKSICAEKDINNIFIENGKPNYSN